MCALPKGFIKNLKLTKPVVGFERRQEVLDGINDKGAFLPRGVHYEDMDGTFIDMVEKDISVIIDGERVPVIFLTIQKWSEFSKTWQHSDEYKNVKIPFITVVRINRILPGTNQGGNWNEVGIRNYTYVKVPTFEGGRKGVDVYKIPQPTSVDVDYEIRFFSNRMSEINLFNENLQLLFQSRQHYIYVNGHPMPIHLENINDESNTEDFNKRKFYVQKVDVKLLGYILNENEFEIIPTVNRLVVNEEIIQPKIKTKIGIKKNNKVTTINYSFIIKPRTNNRFNFKPDYDIRFTDLTTYNLNNISFKVNGVNVTIPFVALVGDIVSVNFNKDFYETSEFNLNGVIL